MHVEVSKGRSLIGAANKDDLAATMRQLRLGRKGDAHAVLLLDPTVAGAISHVAPYVQTRIVVAGGAKIPLPPDRVARLGRRTQIMKPTPYEIGGRPGQHFAFTDGERARVEHHDGFTLVAWSTRLGPAAAFRLLLAEADVDAGLYINTLAGSHDSPLPDELQLIAQRPELLRLMRVDNDDTTLIWELKVDAGFRPPRGRTALRQARPATGGYLKGDSSVPEVVVMADAADASAIAALIERTATPIVSNNIESVLRDL